MPGALEEKPFTDWPFVVHGWCAVSQHRLTDGVTDEDAVRTAVWALRLIAQCDLERARAIRRDTHEHAYDITNDAHLASALRRSRWRIETSRPLPRVVR